MDKTKGIVFGVLAAFIYGFTPILGKLTYLEGSNTMSLAFYRSSLSLPFLFLALKKRKINFKLERGQVKKLALSSALGPTLTTLTLYGSYRYISVGMSTTIHYIYPVLVTVASIFIFKEKVAKEKILALFLSTLGVMLFFEGNFNILGVSLAFLSGVIYAAHILYLDKSGLKMMDPFKLSFYLSVFTSLYLFIAGSMTKSLVFLMTAKGWTFTILVAFFVSFLANTFITISIKHVGATITSIIGLFEPITSIFMGILFLQEPLTIKSVIAAILILSGVTIITFTKEKDPLK